MPRPRQDLSGAADYGRSRIGEADYLFLRAGSGDPRYCCTASPRRTTAGAR